MGFIERLRRQKEDQKRRDAETARVNREQEKQRNELREAERLAKIEKVAIERQKASDFLKKSQFPLLTVELSSIVSGMYKKELSSTSYGSFASESESVDFQITLKWDISRSDSGTRYKEVDIICFPDGKIQVKGKRTRYLLFKEWSENPAFQEKALEEAYEDPILGREPHPLSRGRLHDDGN